ncbi:MAG: fibronectin type III domain-containing protein [Flavobacteriales bacterium]|nr:fibronectin type III domain-containing protein [Flavobacteriales bacterium]
MMRRDEACTHLRMLLRGLGGYVQNVSRGDAAIIQSAGFETKRKVQPSAPLAAPERVVAMRTEYPGTLVVRWGGVKNRKCYEVQVNGGDPTDASAWCTLTFTGQNQVRAEGLESQRQYYFRVIAFGAKGCSPVSDIAMAKAA